MLSTLVLVNAALTAYLQVGCVVLVSIFLVFCCIPAIHKPVRAVVRPWVVYHVEGGLDWVAYAQKFQRSWLTAACEHASNTVSVPFYGIILPTVIWMGLPELGWHLVVLMTLTLYVGNAIKDLASAPRPLGVKYGKARLKILGTASKERDMNAQEYGCPSSHTMNTLCLNFYACHYLHEHQIVSNSTAAVLYALVLFWVLGIASSRIYLGLHTPIDLMVGATAGLTVVTCFIAIEDVLNAWVQQPPHVAIAIAGLVSLVLLRLHPKPQDHTPSFQFSTAFMGVMFGVIAGVSRLEDVFFEPRIQLGAVLDMGWFWGFRRLFAGFAVVLLSKQIFRALSFTILPSFYMIFPVKLRRLWQPPVHNLYKPKKVDPALIGLPLDEQGRTWDVIMTSKFFSYAGIGFAACELAPRLFKAMNW